MQLNKSNRKTQVCKICFCDIEESMHSIIHKDSSICHRCFEKFHPKLNELKITNFKIIYLFDYDQTVKELLYQFKGCFDIELSRVFLEYFSDYFRIKFHGYYLIPAPSSNEGDNARGFNHIVEMFSCLRMPFIKCVHKTEDIKQADLKSEERKNISKHLTIDNVNLSNKKVLIVDDVYTTGSTIQSMINLVKTRHPKEIKVLVMSKTMDLNDQNRPN